MATKLDFPSVHTIVVMYDLTPEEAETLRVLVRDRGESSEQFKWCLIQFMEALSKRWAKP